MTGFAPTFVASGSGHRAGSVPDPGSTAGTSNFLREDATWDVPPGTGITVADVSTTVNNVTEISFSGALVTDDGGGQVTALIQPTLDTVHAERTSNINCAAGVWTAVETITPSPAGSYMFWGTVTVQAGGTEDIYARIFDGTNERGAAIASFANNGDVHALSVSSDPITCDGTTTAISLEVYVPTGDAAATALGGGTSPVPSTTTHLRGLRIAP